MEYRGRISQCMIVKNEEKNIERALTWGKGIVFEQIVVDTGSTDRTVEIAERMGAKVFHFPWINDFSAAKNYAIEQASGEWIAFLDADEYFLPEDARKIPDLLDFMDAEHTDTAVTGWFNLNDENEICTLGSQNRIFRNIPEIRYHGKIHEGILMPDGSICRFTDATKELAILHTGYQDAEKRTKNKSERNRELIEAELQKNPDNIDMLGYMGDECLASSDLQRAEEWYQRAWERMRRLPLAGAATYRNILTLFSLLELRCRINAPEEGILELYEYACSLNPKEGDFDYLLGRYYFQKEEWERTVFYLKNALGKLNKFGICVRSTVLGSKLKDVLEMEAKCFLEMGDAVQAVSVSSEVLSVDPYRGMALEVLLRAFKGECPGMSVPPDETLEFLWRSYHLDQPKDRLLLHRMAGKVQWTELESILYGLLTEEEKEAVEKSCCNFGEEHDNG